MDYYSEGILNGICVIIDDEAEKEDTDANELVKSIKKEGALVATYDHIPQDETIDYLCNASYIIVDWDYSKADLPEGTSLGEQGQTSNKQNVLTFLQEILDKFFIPIFLITGKELDDVRSNMIQVGLLSETEPNRIILKTKDEISDYSSLKLCIEQWLSTTPSALALKIWEKEAIIAKHKMFNVLYQASPAWVGVLRESIEADSTGDELASNYDFQAMLNNNFINRMKAGKYKEINCEVAEKPAKEEIRNVIEGERFIKYDGDYPDISYVGDIYKSNTQDQKEYYLNIRAQCSLLHGEKPVLYVIKGTPFELSSISNRQRIKLKYKEDGNAIRIHKDNYQIKLLEEYNQKETKEFNDKMETMENATFFSQGELISKKKEAFVSCIDNQYVVRFDFNTFETKEKEDLEKKATRIGRLIPPYITKIQQECAAYIVREGIMPLPRSLFFDED